MKTLVLLFLCCVANASEVHEDSDPIVILDGKPIRRSRILNLVTPEAEKPKCLT